MIKADSVKERLKNQSASGKKTMQEALIAYGLERTVYRISVSDYSKNFVLKGGIFLYALFEGEFARATRDIDLLADNISNNAEDMQKVFRDIFSIKCDDALIYDLDTLTVRNITEFKEYHGVNVSIMAYLNRTRVPVSIDIGFGDVIYPEKVMMEFPVMFNMDAPKIYVYSVYSLISEKFEAIVSLGNATSRYKDFYDIYAIADRYELDGDKLREAIKETFGHRETGFDDIVALEEEFINNTIHQSRWNSFINNKKALLDVRLNEAISLIKDLLLPIVNSIENNLEFPYKWSHKERKWI